jgi:hypothetical protein
LNCFSDLAILTVIPRRLINVAPPTTKPDMDKLTREDGPLFEEVFFGGLDKEEMKVDLQKVGNIRLNDAVKEVPFQDDGHRSVFLDFTI